MDTKDAHLQTLLADRIAAEARRPGRTEAEVQVDLLEADELRQRAADSLRVETVVEGVGNELVERTAEDAPASLSTAVLLPSRVTTKASVERLSMIATNGVFDLALDAAQSVGATTSIEKIIAHGVATAHKAAMDLLEKTRLAADPITEVRRINAVARLMTVAQQGALTLQRLKTGGAQTVTVRHVTVENGGQALIGNVAGGHPEKINGKPHASGVRESR